MAVTEEEVRVVVNNVVLGKERLDSQTIAMLEVAKAANITQDQLDSQTKK